MRKILTFFIMLLPILFIGCQNNKSTKTNKEIRKNAQILNSYIQTFSFKDSDIEQHPLLPDSICIPEYDDISIIYLLNSSCSVCIRDFIIFLDTVKKAGIDKEIFAIVNNNDVVLLDYYLSLDNQNNIYNNLIVIDTGISYPFGMSHTPPYIYIIYKRSIVTSLSYINGQLSIKNYSE